jgi:nuclear protein localization family protein 4
VLLAKVASGHDLSDGLQLQHTGGWATLLTILKEAGERPPKRVLGRRSSNGSDSESSNLAKRVKGVSLKGG